MSGWPVDPGLGATRWPAWDCSASTGSATSAVPRDAFVQVWYPSENGNTTFPTSSQWHSGPELPRKPTQKNNNPTTDTLLHPHKSGKVRWLTPQTSRLARTDANIPPSEVNVRGPLRNSSVHPLPPTSMHIILILCNRQVGSRLYHRSSSSLHAATTGALRWRRLCYRRGPRSQSAALMERQGRGLATRSGDKVVQDSVTVDSVGVVLGILSQLLLVRKSSSLFCLENMSYMT